MITIQRIDARKRGFEIALQKLIEQAPEGNESVAKAAELICEAVRARGDAALIEYTNRFDRRTITEAAELLIPASAREQAWTDLPDFLKTALAQAAQRIEAYARRQAIAAFEYSDDHGNRIGQRVTALDRAGIYVPGGKAAYPSSVLMNAIPATVAGVGEIIMVVPAPGGEVNNVVLAASHLCNVDRVYTIGGAQAIAALAFGTNTIPAVDKIVGPGNAYVAAAKRFVFGRVGIDAVAGPSEIVIICDGGTDPRWIAMDLFSQAEHDEMAQAILISPDESYLDKVHEAMNARLRELPRAAIVKKSIADRGAMIVVKDLNAAVDIANRIAPEHLELSVEDPRALLARVRHAGAVFLGRHTPEAFGDYCAGPNHVLPTSRAARYSNPLGVYEFQKRTSLIECTPQGANELAAIAGALANAEGLQAHALSARDRNT